MTITAGPTSTETQAPGPLLQAAGTAHWARDRPGPAPPRRARPGYRRAVTGGLSLLIVAGVFGFALPRFASYGTVWSSLTALRWPALALIAATLAASQLATWAMITSVLPRLRLREAAAVNLSSSAVANTLPAGGAVAMGVSWGMMSGWGVGTADYLRYTVVSGVWNVLARLGLPVVALSILAVTGRSGFTSQVAAAVSAGALVVVAVGFRTILRSERVAHVAGRVADLGLGAAHRLLRRKPPRAVTGMVLDFRTGAAQLLAERGLRISVTTAASQVSLWLVLLACLRGSGLTQAQVSWETSLAAFAFAQVLSVLPITPGGLGVVEFGLTGPLIMGMDPAGAARVTAAVLLYRAVTYLLPIPLGGAAFLWWRRARTARRRGAAGVAASGPGGPAR